MPYIKQEDRDEYKEELDGLCKDLEVDSYPAGHVTYILYMIVARWFKKFPCYDTIAKIRGCLIGTLAEFDRCIAAPYEDKKIKENGDVDLGYSKAAREAAGLRPEQPCICGGNNPNCEKCIARRGGA